MIYTITLMAYGSGAIIDQQVGASYFENNTPDKAKYSNADFEGVGRIICVKDSRGRLWA